MWATGPFTSWRTYIGLEEEGRHGHGVEVEGGDGSGRKRELSGESQGGDGSRLVEVVKAVEEPSKEAESVCSNEEIGRAHV